MFSEIGEEKWRGGGREDDDKVTCKTSVGKTKSLTSLLSKGGEGKKVPWGVEVRRKV